MKQAERRGGGERGGDRLTSSWGEGRRGEEKRKDQKKGKEG